MSLTQELLRTRQMMSNSASRQINLDLIHADVLAELETSSDEDLQGVAGEVDRLFKQLTQPEQVDEAAKLFELYGESLALLELKRRANSRGCSVRRLDAKQRAKKGMKTPDILCNTAHGSFYIEIKVLDMVGGKFTNRAILREAFENGAELAGRIKPGVNFAKPLEITPHGRVGRPMAEMLDDYIRRIGSNIKKEQVTLGPTFLLIVDLRIPLDSFHPSYLVPTYFRAAPHGGCSEGECMSGLWWQVGHGRSGDLILGTSEFEGSGNLSGRQVADGILFDHPYLMGLSVLSSNGFGATFSINTLVKIGGRDGPEPEIVDAGELAWHFSDAYNDERNSNGWEYQTRS